MTSLFSYLKGIIPHHHGKDIALVLGGGGARGFAHIGAIEVLEEHGYHITSVAGTSMGALVGGLYAAGGLDELKERVLGLTRRQILSLVGVSIGLDHITTADKLTELLDKMTGGKTIEHLAIPFCCSASDLTSGKEHVFRSGSLSMAIRASISIPGIFSPVRIDGMTLVDGSVHNTLPLNRVARHKDDILVAINVSAPDAGCHETTVADAEQKQRPVWKWLKGKLPFLRYQYSDNYLKMALRVCQVAIQNNTQMAIDTTKPDILVNIPMDAYGLLDFERGKEIIEYGRQAMEKELEE